jgi:hypothetical protein
MRQPMRRFGLSGVAFVAHVAFEVMHAMTLAGARGRWIAKLLINPWI